MRTDTDECRANTTKGRTIRTGSIKLHCAKQVCENEVCVMKKGDEEGDERRIKGE